MKHGNARTAGNAVAMAIRKGTLEPASKFRCVDCGDKASDYDHRDYRKPLEVVPVCRSCNLLRGSAKRCGCKKCSVSYGVLIATRAPAYLYDQMTELAKKNRRSLAGEIFVAIRSYIEIQDARAMRSAPGRFE